MSREKGIRLGASIALALLGLLAYGLAGSWRATADSHTLAIASANIPRGVLWPVELTVRDIAPPGLGAWTVDIIYDPASVTAVDCTTPPGSVCNEDYGLDRVRVAGASAAGIEGDATLATLIFTCNSPASSALTVDARDLFDATPGDPQPLQVTLQHGVISCLVSETSSIVRPPSPRPEAPAPAPAEFPDAGGAGFGDVAGSPIGWLIAGLAGAGLAWLAFGLASATLAATAGAPAPAVRAPRLPSATRAAPQPMATARTVQLTLRVSPVESFSAFVDALAALGRAPGVVSARAVRLQGDVAVFDVTAGERMRVDAVQRAMGAALGHTVRVEREA